MSNTPKPQANTTVAEILETLAAEAFIFGNFALGKGVSTPLPDNDHKLPPVEKAHKAIQALITEAVVRLANQYGEPRCENLHHAKKSQHTSMQDCPVEKAISEQLKENK